jgi:hypothetical protein
MNDNPETAHPPRPQGVGREFGKIPSSFPLITEFRSKDGWK